MEIRQKKCRTTGKKALEYRGKGGQNTDTAQKLRCISQVLQLRAPKKGDSKREKPDPERTFSQIFADFHWFSARSVNQGIWGSQIFAENRRKPQIFAGNRRNPQIFAETGFSHLLSPFWRAPSSRTLKTTQIRGAPKSEFSGSQKWGRKRRWRGEK